MNTSRMFMIIIFDFCFVFANTINTVDQFIQHFNPPASNIGDIISDSEKSTQSSASYDSTSYQVQGLKTIQIQQQLLLQ